MYNSVVAPGAAAGAGAGSGAIAYTGPAMEAVWLALGAFALVSAGMALVRSAPKEQA